MAQPVLAASSAPIVSGGLTVSVRAQMSDFPGIGRHLKIPYKDGGKRSIDGYGNNNETMDRWCMPARRGPLYDRGTKPHHCRVPAGRLAISHRPAYQARGQPRGESGCTGCEPRGKPGCTAASPAASPVASAASPAASPVASAASPAGSFMRAIQDRGVLRAGVKQDVLLFGYLNPRTNKIEGFDVDIAKEIARVVLGDPEKVDLRGMASAARIPSLTEGTVDIVVSTMTITKERMAQIDFADVYYESGQMILVPGNSEITGIQDTAGKRVCAAKGSTSETNITKFSPEAIVVQADVYSECLLAMQQGRTDAISTDDVILLGLAEQDPSTKLLSPPFTQEPYGIGIAKGHPEFVDLINATLTQLKNSGRWAEIHKQWLGKYIQTPAPPSRTAADAAI